MSARRYSDAAVSRVQGKTFLPAYRDWQPIPEERIVADTNSFFKYGQIVHVSVAHCVAGPEPRLTVGRHGTARSDRGRSVSAELLGAAIRRAMEGR